MGKNTMNEQEAMRNAAVPLYRKGRMLLFQKY